MMNIAFANVNKSMHCGESVHGHACIYERRCMCVSVWVKKMACTCTGDGYYVLTGQFKCKCVDCRNMKKNLVKFNFEQKEEKA